MVSTEHLLQTLGDLGYQALAKKVQLYKQQVQYLGYILKVGKFWLSNAHNSPHIPNPRKPQPSTGILEDCQVL